MQVWPISTSPNPSELVVDVVLPLRHHAAEPRRRLGGRFTVERLYLTPALYGNLCGYNI